MNYVGKDCSEVFEKQGHSKKAIEMAQMFYVGEFCDVSYKTLCVHVHLLHVFMYMYTLIHVLMYFFIELLQP